MDYKSNKDLNAMNEQIPNRSISNKKREELTKNIGLEFQDIQIRTLTKWIQVQLKEPINNITQDFRDGKKLLALLQAVSTTTKTLKPEKGHMRIHELSNVAQALKFLQEQWGADNLPAIGSEAIVNGDTKSTLAILFFIMIKYQVHPIINHFNKLNVPIIPLPTSSTSSLQQNNHSSSIMTEAKLALLYWVQCQLDDYVQYQIISCIQDFSRSWRSGLAFCLLIHRYDPDMIPTLFHQHHSIHHDKSNWFTLLGLAFDIAEKQLGVPKYLEPQDLLQVEYPHEPSVMVYVSALYHVMSLKEDTQREKRLHDISLVTMTTTTMLDSSASSSNILDSSTTTTTTTQEEDEEEQQLPSTPQPELLFHKEDVYQQLNTLSDLLKQQDKVQSRQLLDNTNKLIMQLPSNSQQIFMNQYNQLKSEWELISSKRPEQVQHSSLYVNESNPLVKMISEIHSSISAQLHPLDCDLVDTDEFDRSLKHVATLIQVDNITDTDTIAYFQATEQACHLLKRGLTFKQITCAIHNELESIQQWMSSKDQGTTVTHSTIQQLEQRIHVVNATIQGVREEYTDVLLYDTSSDYYDRYTGAIDSIEDQYETVRDWIDQVRVWFLEAERIRAWIDQHIGILEHLEEIQPIERDLTVSDTKAVQLFEDHERLKSEIDHFDGDDMNRLRAHVKMLTLETHQELTPADTSTIEITLTTLNMLNQLTQSLNKRSHVIQLLVNRVKWEDLFGRAVQWIASTDQQLDVFLRDARWKEVQQSLDIEDIINMLVNLEHKISDFDRGDYTQVLDAYQDMESLETLPDYLEVRQVGFEHCFEDLMKRSGFSRLIVEQLLSMMSTVDKFKQLRNTGEQLRQTLLNDSHSHDDEVYAEQVQSFKEDSAKLITSATVPYPEAPVMQTAIGAHDTQDNLVTNENIKSTLSAYSMSLALIADGLDQLLNSRYQLSSLQQRVTEALEAMARSMAWMNERIKLLERPLAAIKDDDAVIQLEKERDAIALRLSQTDDAKLFELVQVLEYDIDRANNAVSIDRDLLITHVEQLASTHQLLQDLLQQRSVDLEKLKKKMEWESQWNKTNSHVQTLARKLCDFNVKKARYDPAKEEKPNYAHDHENRQAMQLLQDRIQELGDRHVSLLVQAFDGIENETKQEDLLRDYEDLKRLASYTVDLMTQRATITEFLLRSIDLTTDGEKIKEAITKRTRSTAAIQEESTTLEDRATKLKAEITRLWQECGNTVSYPVYNGQWLKSSDSGPYRSQVRAQIKTMLDNKMQELNSLTASLDQLLSVYHEADRLKLLASQYEQEARDLANWIDQQMDTLQQHHLDVSAEAWSLDLNLKQLVSSRTDMLSQVDQFEQDKVKLLHDQLANLVQDAVDKKKSTVNVSAAARQLGQVMDRLSQLKRALVDHAITLEAATKRAEWETSLQVGLTKLQAMNDQLSQFTTKKNQWMALEDVTDQQVSELQGDLQRLTSQRQHFENSVLPGIQLSYDAFVDHFPKLPRPMATPDHLEARMESLSRTAQRLEEHVAARSKELELIKERMQWEDTVKQALVYLSSKESSLEQFIERARWHYTVVDSDDEIELRTAWASLSQDITTYQHDVITPLQHAYEALVSETADHIVTLPTSVAKKMQDVQVAQQRVDQYLDFSNQVVSQRCLVAAFILRTAQLEQSAELIREEFIANTQQLGGSEMAGLFETHTQRLAKFKDGVTDVRENLANSIPYPVRTDPLVANMKDENTHAVVKETVGMRNARLDEIYVGLQQLLISKERVSRKRLSLHAYQKQAALVSQWIDQRRSLLSETVHVDKLKIAVSQAESVEQAMKVQDNVYTLLVTAFDKCIQAFEQPSEQEEQHVDHSEVKPTQEKITQEWNALLQQATQSNAYRTALLIKQKVEAWVSQIDSLFAKVTQGADEEQVAVWMTQCDQLEQSYTTLTLEITQDLLPMLNNGHAKLQEIKKICLDLQRAFYLNQLIQRYLQGVTALQSLIQAHTTLLTETNEQYKCIDSESSADSRTLQHQQLVSVFKQATDNMTDLEDIQENIVAQFKAILAIDSSYESNQALSKQWQQAQELQAILSSLVARSAKWITYFNTLATIRSQLKSIDFGNQEQYPVHVEQLNSIDLSSHLVEELVQDKINSEPYERQRLVCLALQEQLKSGLQQHISSQARSSLLSTAQQIADTLCSQCNVQLESAKSHTVDLSSATPCNDLIKSVENITKDVEQELELLQAQQCDQLLKLDCSQEQVDAIIAPVSDLLTKLQDVISTENQHLESVQLLNKFKTLKSCLLETLSQGIQALTGHCVETLITSWESQLESIDDSKSEFETLAQQVNQSKIDVQQKYGAFISQLQQARAGLENSRQRTSIIVKSNDFIAYIASMTDRVNSLQLNDKSSVSVAEERELQDICHDFTITSDKKTIALNSLLDSHNDKDDAEIKTLQQQLSQDMTAFKLLLSIKQKQASDHGDLSHFSSLMSQFDHHTLLLTTAISNASPHHSSMLQGKFVKSDLQALLKSLISSYKEAQQAISNILPKARQEANLHLSETADAMTKANKRWSALQASAAARERELQTCIQHLDHEFFTNLALAKTKSRHYASLPKERLPINAVMPTFSPRRSFDDSSSSSSAKKRPLLISASSSTSRMSRYTSSYVPDPRSQLDIELSKIVNAYPYRVHVRVVPDQVGKYWFGDENPKLVYCRILPSQLVMVRVGGGWVELSKFLREHGLTEGAHSRPTSQQDYSVPFQESYVSLRSTSPSARITIRGGNGGNVLSSRSSSRSTTGSRSRSPLPGFVDGDKFVMDEAGSSLVIKMKKADQYAKTPIIKKKK